MLFLGLTTDNNALLPHSSITNLAFAHLDLESPMCRLLVDLHYYFEGEVPAAHEVEENINPTFAFRMWRRYRKNKDTMCHESSAPYELDICDHHDHETDEEKAGCKKKQEKARACRRALAFVSNESDGATTAPRRLKQKSGHENAEQRIDHYLDHGLGQGNLIAT